MPPRLRPGALATWFIAAMSTLVIACSDHPATISTDAEYSEGRGVTVHARADRASGPIVVLLHGAGRNRNDYQDFAARMAEAGAVVFNSDWTVLPAATDIALGEIGCALWYAAVHGPDYGGDPHRLILAAHSSAAIYAGAVAGSAEMRGGPCSIDGDPVLPDGLALLSPAQVPGGAPWRHAMLGGNPDLEVAVIHGIDDTVARPSLGERTATILDQAGYATSLVMVPGGHLDLVLIGEPGPEPRVNEAAGLAIAAILDLAGTKIEPASQPSGG